MSVAVEWPVGPVMTPAPARPRLTLVPAPAPAAEPAPGRLTRRGRLLRTLVIFTALAIVVLWRLAPVADAADLTVEHSATVRAGQSLTDIAHEQLPSLGVDEGVRRLRIVNGLQGTAVFPGQRLEIPVNR